MAASPRRPRVHRLILGAAGAPAAAVLDGGGPLETVAVFERSFYAADREGRLVCFVRDDLEPGPLNLLCSGWPDDLGRLLPEKAVWTPRGGVLASPHLEISPAEKRLWRPHPCPAPEPERMRDGMRALLELVRRHCPDDSVAKLAFAPFSPPDGMRGAILSATEKGVAGLSSWLADRDSGGNPLSLLGLGGGLTPSGDDVLGGALLGLRAMGLIRQAEALADLIGSAARHLTNRISQAHLEAAGLGLGAAPLHDCLAATLAGGIGVAEVIPRLSRVGHTSGWDAILGMIVAMRHYLETGCGHRPE